jgi:hypothetical protein
VAGHREATGDPHQRIIACSQTILNAPANAKVRVGALVNRGHAHEALEELALALADYQAALEIDANSDAGKKAFIANRIGDFGVLMAKDDATRRNRLRRLGVLEAAFAPLPIDAGVAGDRGEVAFMKDGRVRYNPAEKAAIIRHRVRCFCVSRRDLTAEAMTRRFLQNLDRIADACSKPGPFMYAVHENRIEQLDL